MTITCFWVVSYRLCSFWDVKVSRLSNYSFRRIILSSPSRRSIVRPNDCTICVLIHGMLAIRVLQAPRSHLSTAKDQPVATPGRLQCWLSTGWDCGAATCWGFQQVVGQGGPTHTKNAHQVVATQGIKAMKSTILIFSAVVTSRSFQDPQPSRYVGRTVI